MKLDALAMAKAAGTTAAILWIICSLLVVGMPGQMMSMSGSMVHADLGNMSWAMTGTGFFVGLVAWTIVAALTGWVFGVLYNRFVGE